MGHEGTVVAGRFEIERLAGTGGMGAVYRANDRATGRLAAVKILHGEATASHRERFARETQLLAELVHPAVVGYLAHGFTDRREPFLAMEWLEGEDVQARLRRLGLTPGESVRLARRVAEALAAAHARGIIHRDIKPSNLFLVGGDIDRVKVLDFGIARLQAADAMTRTGTAIGTPGYMAPEQARGSRDVDAAADVFSLGCVLFECLVGHPPFIGESAMATLAKILLEDAPRLSSVRDGLPAALDDLLARMLAKDRAARPRDGAAVAAQLDAIGDIANDLRAQARTRDSAVTVGELRLVCVVFAAGAVARTPIGPATERSSAPFSVDTAHTVEDALSTARTAQSDVQSTALPALSAAVAAHGGQAEVLADGSVVVTVLGQGAATDQAARAARCALAVRDVVPLSPMALAIGRGPVGERAPFGELIDRAAELLRAPAVATATTQIMQAQSARLPIRVDEVAAGLLDIRFVISGDDEGLVLVGERDVADPARTLLGRPTPCVGRERELAALGALFDESVSEPMAHVVVVTAPAGVGKSRLRHEFLQRLSVTDVEIWIGRGNQMSAGAPFALLAQALRRACGIVDDEPATVRHLKLKARISRHVLSTEVARLAEFLGELVGAPSHDEGSVQLRAARQDPQLMGDQMLRACEDFFSAESAARPVVLVLEDLQWGDLPTVRFVDAIVRRLPDRPLLVLGLARPEVDAVFPRLWAERGAERIALGELTRRAAEKLVRDALGPVDEAALGRIVERAAGNAFYLEELIRSVAEGKGDRLPDTIVAMAQARIESLELEARHVLRAASIFGQVFWRGGVHALLDGATTQVGDWIDELVHRELIAPRRETRFAGEIEYGFRHALVREAAYAMLTERDRMRGHRRAGEWLEQQLAGARPLEAEAVILAEHFQRGGDSRRSVTWFRQAAEQALEGDDLAGAIDRAERAIACVEPGTERELVGALRQLQSGAHVWRGEYALAEERGSQAIDLLPPASGPWLVAAAALADARERRLEHAKTRALCYALADVDPTPATFRAYAHAVAMTMSTLLWHVEPSVCEQLFTKLDHIERAARGSDPAALAWIYHARSWRAMRAGDVAACLVLDTRVVEYFTAVGDLRHACQQRANVGYDEVQLGAFARAEVSLRTAISIASRVGLHQVTAQAQHNLGLAVARQGRLDEARVIETEALDAFVAQDNRRLASASHHYLALIELAAGDLGKALAHARDALAAAPDVPALQISFHATMSTASRIAGDPGNALAHATRGMELMASHGPPEEGASALRLAYAEALYANGALGDARRAIDDAEARLYEAAARIGDPDWRKSYLEAIPEHSATLALARFWRGG